MTEEEFNLSEKIEEIEKQFENKLVMHSYDAFCGSGVDYYDLEIVKYKIEELKEIIKEFISLIKAKILMDWKGQNEFIDWLKRKSGDKLI